MDRRASARLRMVSSMIIFGTIGVFVRGIGLPSSVVAISRGLIGSAILLPVMLIKGERFHVSGMGRSVKYLCASGVLLGFNWILLFEAYKYTTVATATLCYYMAPLIVAALSPLLFKEKLTRRRGLCFGAALLGMVFVSGLLGGGTAGGGGAKGIFFGLGAALLYAGIVIFNKLTHGVGAYQRTVIQLAISAAVMLVYNLLTVDISSLSLTPSDLLLLLTVGAVHTGLAYTLYFGSIEALPAQSAALLSYIDPAVAVLTSLLILREPLTPALVLGAVLIIGAAIVSELPERAQAENN